MTQETLVKNRQGREPSPAESSLVGGGSPAGQVLRGRDLSGQDLSGQDLSGQDLSGVDFTGADLSEAKLFRTKLRGAILRDAKLFNAELSGADLSAAILENVDARQAGFGSACLQGAKLFKADLTGSTLSKANLEGADLSATCLRNARMREARLVDANFTNADLRTCDLSLSDVSGASFRNATMQDCRLRQMEGFDKANWIGVDVRDINFAGAYRVRRYILDQNYIKEFRESSRLAGFLYYLWWLSSDCGRSMLRWCLLILTQAAFYALLYRFTDIDYGQHATWLSPFYYSVVTLTSLGYGDVVPASWPAQCVAMLEVVTGYVMLGGLLSIFSNKIARRAD